MTNHQELIDLWRESSKEPSFVKWLDNKQKKCEFCDKPCGKSWCVTVEETFEELDEVLEELGIKEEE